MDWVFTVEEALQWDRFAADLDVYLARRQLYPPVPGTYSSLFPWDTPVTDEQRATCLDFVCRAVGSYAPSDLNAAYKARVLAYLEAAGKPLQPCDCPLCQPPPAPPRGWWRRLGWYRPERCAKQT